MGEQCTEFTFNNKRQRLQTSHETRFRGYLGKGKVTARGDGDSKIHSKSLFIKHNTTYEDYHQSQRAAACALHWQVGVLGSIPAPALHHTGHQHVEFPTTAIKESKSLVSFKTALKGHLQEAATRNWE